MESRKYQLQKQIIEALNSNDSDLYSLLKSQWAHRFGVESLEELKNLDLNQLNKKPANLNSQKIDQSPENYLEQDKAIYIEGDDNQEEKIKTKEFDSIKNDHEEAPKIKSYEIVEKKNYGNNAVNQFKDNKSQLKVNALIPLPPKPKYSYLKKWLLRSKF